MVLFFIAELALTVAFKLSTWCLGKTFNGIMYIVKRHKHDKHDDDNADGDDFVVISHQEYCGLKKTHELHLHQVSSSEEASAEEASHEEASSEEASV